MYYDGTRVKSRSTRLDLAKDNAAFELDGTRFTVEVYQTSLPVLSIDTYENAPVYSKEFFVSCEASLYTAEGQLDRTLPASVRVRGNTTSMVNKLPYKLRLTTETSLLGMAAATDWVLLANFYDPTMIRNSLAMDMARAMDVAYVSEFQFVELYVRGQYRGVYALGTQIALSTANVNLPPLEKTADGWQGSYLLELDTRYTTDEAVMYTAEGIPIEVKEPKRYDDEMLEEMERDLRRLEACLASENLTADGLHYTDVIDLASFAKTFVLHEAVGNSEAAAPFSIYLYRDANGLLCVGPPWDFDLGFYTDTEGFLLQNAYWFTTLCRQPEFQQEVAAAYAMLDEYFDGFDERADGYAAQLAGAERNNFIITYIGVNDYSNLPADDPYEEELAKLKLWMAERRAWLNESIHSIDDTSLGREEIRGVQ